MTPYHYKRLLTSSRGSTLIMILWILVLVGFLVVEHAAHNRDKAALAGNARQRLMRDQAVLSVLDVIGSAAWPLPKADQAMGKWFKVEFDDQDIWVRVDSESARKDLNTADEATVRQELSKILGIDAPDETEDRILEQADELTDALFDWRDPDSLERTYGAEDDAYIDAELSWLPANGPFKVFTEPLLVLGMTTELFWGRPLDLLLIDLEEQDLALKDTTGDRRRSPKNREGESDKRDRLGLIENETIRDFWDVFTIYGKDVTRVTMLIVGQDRGYTLVAAFLKKKSGKSSVLEMQEMSFGDKDVQERLAEMDELITRTTSPWKVYRAVSAED